MIDYSPRRVNLFHQSEEAAAKYPVVCRAMQVLALLPHTMLNSCTGSDRQTRTTMRDSLGRELLSWKEKEGYSAEEVRIRDAYDELLDGLERFASNMKAGLVTRKQLNPYLKYWVQDIAEFTKDKEDALWTCAFMVYVQFYGFRHVQWLFKKYGSKISVDSKLFNKQAALIADEHPTLVDEWREACRNMKLRDSSWAKLWGFVTRSG
jgi:hypothetical protein